jgi:hypothetical protein
MLIKRMIFGGVLASCGLFAGVTAATAQATLPGASFSVACENGASYVLESGPVANPGDIVTARFYLSPRHALPVRLIPMGDGYRYAGRGLWLDGIRAHALLYRHKYQPIACVVARI